jgi:outer membrane protein OmpA-like peptidoglycan-associated protein
VFDLHTAELTEAGRKALSEAAERLACAPDRPTLVVSNGDPHRLAGYRRDVAERRTEVIESYFRDNAVSGDRVLRAPSPGVSPVETAGVILIEAVGPDA